MTQLAWSKELIEKVQADVFAEVQGLREELSSEKMIAILRQKIDHENNEGSSIGRLRLFTYGLHLILQFERAGGLTAKEVRDTLQLCHTALTVQRIDPDRSKLSYLYGLIYSAASQASRRQGFHFEAIWDQCLADRHGSSTGGEIGAFMRYSVGNRALRLGNIDWARREYQEAEAQGLSERWRFHCGINKIIAARLTGEFEQAESIIRQLREGETSESRLSELHWQEMTVEAQRHQDLTGMIKACSRRGGHYQGGPVVELALWSMVMPSTKWLDRAPSLPNIRYNKDLQVRKLGVIYDLACEAQSFYGSPAKLTIRLRNLGQLLSRTSELITIDREALAWLAATRALHRARAFEFAEVCRFHYTRLSRDITAGKSFDCLGVAPDFAESLVGKDRGSRTLDGSDDEDEGDAVAEA